MKKLTFIIVVFVLYTLFHAPVSASEHNEHIRGFVNESNNNAFLVAEFDTGSERQAKSDYRNMDADSLEEEFGAIVVEEQELDEEMSDVLGADNAKMFGVVWTEDTSPGLVVVLQEGSTIYVAIAYWEEELDSEAFVLMQIDMTDSGVEMMNIPSGYAEADMDEDERI